MRKSLFVRILLIPILLIPVTVAAINIRVIGNGGGDQEMLALTRYSMMTEYLRFCLKPGNLCGLTEDEIKSIGVAMNHQGLRDAETLIPQALIKVGLDANQAMFLGLLAHAESKIYKALADFPAEWIELSEKLYSEMTWKSAELFLAKSSQRVRSFQVSGRMNRAYLFIENEKEEGTVDLTPLLISKIPCTDPKMRLVGFGRDLKLEREGFSSEVRWTCRDSVFSASSVAISGGDAPALWSFMVYRVHAEETISCPLILSSPHSSK